MLLLLPRLLLVVTFIVLSDDYLSKPYYLFLWLADCSYLDEEEVFLTYNESVLFFLSTDWGIPIPSGPLEVVFLDDVYAFGDLSLWDVKLFFY